LKRVLAHRADHPGVVVKSLAELSETKADNAIGRLLSDGEVLLADGVVIGEIIQWIARRGKRNQTPGVLHSLR
jgi:hypothetical protein